MIGSSALEVVRLLYSQDDPSSNGGEVDDQGFSFLPRKPADGGSALEFAGFIFWYLFLVTCCVVPTCCAYRRRRMMESRIAQQQASFEQLHQQNLFILSSLNVRPDGDKDDGSSDEKAKRITEALRSTTFTVTAGHFLEPEAQGKDIDDTNGDNKTADTEAIDEEMGVSSRYDAAEHSLIMLPADGSRSVTGGCAICLCPYEEGDEVTWSKEETCNHAFHKDCIVSWLSKKDEPNCPCCRQKFCTYQKPASHEFSILTPFGLIPTRLSRAYAGTHFMAGFDSFASLGFTMGAEESTSHDDDLHLNGPIPESLMMSGLESLGGETDTST